MYVTPCLPSCLNLPELNHESCAIMALFKHSHILKALSLNTELILYHPNTLQWGKVSTYKVVRHTRTIYKSWWYGYYLYNCWYSMVKCLTSMCKAIGSISSTTDRYTHKASTY